MGRWLEVKCVFCGGGPVYLVGGEIVQCENCGSRGPSHGGEAAVRDWRALVEVREVAQQLAAALELADEVLTRLELDAEGFRDYEEAQVIAALARAREASLLSDS
jgi:ribosomal protein S27E